MLQDRKTKSAQFLVYTKYNTRFYSALGIHKNGFSKLNYCGLSSTYEMKSLDACNILLSRMMSPLLNCFVVRPLFDPPHTGLCRFTLLLSRVESPW